ncbi:ABC transporter ATP-binding protein [Streptomyces kronopolitis]|uniref:ABC transporter ATP-binding protein n=2 Tax=Streptomyces kronopolitis TaxID=1612435 RepID=A0ABQ2J0R6_9ACTN|nr:ABC transporter ATP-binding protein [Streptomyces kronopolitis]
MTSRATAATAPVLRGTGLTKSFGLTRALAGVDVSVPAGESLAVMGPSGSGKSTLLHCLAGIERPDEGQVLLAGARVDHLGEPERSELRRTHFGFVFQSGQLLPELPADENVALPLMLGGMPRRQAVRKAREWFPVLGLAGKEGRRPGELSGGQAQRVAIARALVGGPQVIFADEPTGALDQATGTEVIGLLVEVTRRQGAALVVVTHDVNVARWCDRTVEVRDGRLTENGRAPAHATRAFTHAAEDASAAASREPRTGFGHDAGARYDR